MTINSDEHGPLEVFVNVGKAGSDIAALAEALGRLISLNLRILSPLSQTDRAQEIAEQLRGIGGSRSVGFGMQQVRSLPDAVARALELHLESLKVEEEQDVTKPVNGANGKKLNNASDSSNGVSVEATGSLSLSHLSVTGNLCPKCGCNTMVHEEGCRKCYSCGHSAHIPQFTERKNRFDKRQNQADGEFSDGGVEVPTPACVHVLPHECAGDQCLQSIEKSSAWLDGRWVC